MWDFVTTSLNTSKNNNYEQSSIISHHHAHGYSGINHLDGERDQQRDYRIDGKSANVVPVTVTFDPRKTDKEKIIKAFKKIGYTASESCLKNQEASESGECCRQESADCH